MADVRSRLIDAFAAVFPEIDPGEIPRASMDSVDDWDSLATVTLVSVIEEEFGVAIQPDDLIHFVSFESILGYLVERRG